MFCKQCGTEVSEKSNFCLSCGSPVNGKTPVQTNEIKTVQKKPQSGRKNSFPRILLAVLCSIMIFVFSLATLTIFTARNCITPKQITNMLEDADIEELIESSNIELDEDINTKDIEKIYHNTSFKDYVEEVADEYSDYILGGKKPKGINAEDIVELVQKNQYKIERILDAELTHEDYDAIYEYFEENGKENLGFLSSEVRTDDSLKALRTIMSPYIIITLLILMALLVFLLIKARLNSIDSLLWISIPIILTSLLFFAYPLAVGFFINVFADMGPEAVGVISIFRDNISNVILINSSLVLITGILLIVIYAIAKKIKK